KELADLGSIPSQDFIKQLQQDSASNPDIVKATTAAEKTIESHLHTVNTLGTLFRGLSAGSILLVVAIGLAITFGLMGVINMAHGELIAVGAYTTYVVQDIYGDGLNLSIALPFGKNLELPISLPGMHLTGSKLDLYFVVAVPLSFLMA